MDYEEEVDYVDGYDCTDLRNEPRPDSVVYQPQFQELKKLCQQVAKLLLKPLEDSKYHNIITRGLMQEIVTRTQNECSEENLFAVAGEMAAGKSSVINSILSKGTIARKGDGGGSCTWVVQRFMKKFQHQKAPFAAHVHFFTTEQIREILKSLLAKYFQASGRDKDDADDEEDKEDKSENFNDMRTVLDTFMALFCEHEKFDTEDRAKRFLKDCSPDDDEDVLDMLVNYAEETVENHLRGQDFISINASTPEDLLFHLQPYTFTIGGEDSRGTTTPWPLVSVIDFGLDQPLLNEGIILVDSPGLSDANSTRRNNAMEYHSQCTHKITVAEIGRAKDDKALRDNLRDGYWSRGSEHTILVLTHGDSIDSDTDVTGNPLEKKREQTLKDELKTLRNDKSKLSQRRQRMSREEKVESENEMKAINTATGKKLDELEALRIDMRNRNVIHAMQKLYKELTTDPKPLPAFVVGNEAYKQHVAGYSIGEKPTLSVEQTGIPSLRRRIFLLPSEGKLNDAMHLATSQLPSLINSFELYCAKTHMARKNEIEALIVQPKEFVRAAIILTVERLKTEVKRRILDPMKQDETDWIKGARKLCKVWAMTYSTTHLQLLKKNGHKRGRKKEDVDICWNAELARINKDAMEDYFRNLQNEMFPHFEELKVRVGKLFFETRKEISNDPQFNLMALDTFLKSFALERPNAIKCIELATRGLRRKIGIIEEQTTLQEEGTFMSQAMAPIYASVRQIKGKGAPKLRVDEFERRVCKMSGVWTDVQDRVERAFDKLLEEQLDSLGKALEGIFDGILNKFNLLCDDTIVKDEKEKVLEEELRQNLEKNLTLAREMVEGPVQTLAMQCKNYSAMKEESALFVPPG